MDIPAQTPAQSRASSLSYLFLFAFIIFMLSDPNSNSGSTGGSVDHRTKEVYASALARARAEKYAIGNATHGNWDASGILLEPDLILDDVAKTLSPFAGGAPGTYFFNITGGGKGKWTSTILTEEDTLKMNLSIPIYGQRAENASNDTEDTMPPPLLDLPLAERLKLNRGTKFDWTSQGEVRLTIAQSDPNSRNYINGTVEGSTFDQAAAPGLVFEDDRNGNSVSLDLQGVHLGSSAQGWALAYPINRHLPLPDIMGLVQRENPDKQRRVGQVLINELDRRIEDYSRVVDGIESGDYGSEKSPGFNCSFHLFIQGHRSEHLEMPLAIYESELRANTGLLTSRPKTPELAITAFSPDCALLIHIKHLAMTTVERTYEKCITYASGLIIIAIAQCLLVIRQMKMSQTPSALSRISYWTIASQALLDGYSCLIHLTVGIVASEIFLTFTAASFVTFVLVSVFQMRFLITIWRIQAPERLIAARETRAAAARAQMESERSRNGSADSNGPSQLDEDGLPPTITAPAASDHEPTFSGQYIRFYILLGIGAVIFIQTQSLPRWVSQPLIAIFMLAAHSFWIPQIVRNVKRGSRRALDTTYLLGMSGTRLYLPLYAYACPDNVLGQRPQSWIWLIVLWLGAQVFFLFLQDSLGPRFFISSRYMPKPYEYHPFFQSSDEENQTQFTGDCAICMTSLMDKEPKAELDGNTAAAGARRTASALLGKNLNLMQAPCGHTFHTPCLQQWMGVRLQCPLCKAALPPDS